MLWNNAGDDDLEYDKEGQDKAENEPQWGTEFIETAVA
jgi:hypothetical protein